VDRISAVDGLGFAVRFEVRGVRQDPPVFRALVSLLADKDEEVRVMAANILAPIRDGDFRGDAGRPEKKAPEGGWAKWLDDITAKEAGYAKDYEVCNSTDNRTEAIQLFCAGGAQLKTKPALAFQNTMKAAEQGYVPAEAALGMMYANGKGVQQDYVEAGKWWSKAAAGGHVLAAANAARAPKVPIPGVHLWLIKAFNPADTLYARYRSRNAFIHRQPTTSRIPIGCGPRGIVSSINAMIACFVRRLCCAI
jgi:Sel1 repeat